MNQFSREMRQRATKEELELLEREGLISADIHQAVAQAQESYNLKVMAKEQDRIQQITLKRKAEEVAKKKEIKRKTLSPQEVRERNISWLLSLGVILLLVGGLVLATSAWDMLADWMKTGLVAFVALLFFGLAFVTMRILKIKKTAFAFYVLGSLFLPILILSAGFFELFGPYFSFTGEGRFIYGAIGSLVIMPVFIILTKHLASRLFVWFTYVTLSSMVSFFIASLYLMVDGFYLGVMLFNAVLILLYRYLKDNQTFKPFTAEFVPFIQANLILSTLLMLVFYQNELMYSVNLFLTAVIYFAMIFVTKHKEYHFVFSAMLVYGAYQLIEFSALVQIDGIAYALLGFIFLALPKLAPNDTALRTVFRYTSAIVSGAAFIYISFEGILLRINEPSIVLLLAYLVISLNFIFLANSVQQVLFKYLSPIFLVAASAELVLLTQKAFGYDSFLLSLFICMVLLYSGLGCYMKRSFFQSIKESTRDVTLSVMVLSLLFGWLYISYWETGLMFMLLSGVALFMDHFEKRPIYTVNSVASYTHVLTLGLATLFFYGEQNGIQYGDGEILSFSAQHFITASMVILFVSFIWRYFKRPLFFNHGFYMSQGFYLIGIVLALNSDMNDLMRSAILFGGIAMAYLLYKKVTDKVYAYGVSSLSLMFYFTLIYWFENNDTIQFVLYDELQFITGAVLLLVTGLLIGKRDVALKISFWWVAHLYLPLALMLTFISLENIMWTFVLATIIYSVSIWFVKSELKIKLFLYASFTVLFLTIGFLMDKFNQGSEFHYIFLITSIIILFLWFFSKGLWTKRIAYYIVPFSVIGLSTFSLATPFSLTLLILLLVYAIGVLYIMHQQKWTIYNIVPLLIVFNAGIMFGDENFMSHTPMFLLLTGFALASILAGLMLYRFVYEDVSEKETVIIDWYTVIGFIASFYLYLYIGEVLWTKLLPGLLISCWLILQRKRVRHCAPIWFIFAASVYLLQPYYALLDHFSIPEIIERELYILPWLIFVIFLKKIITATHKQVITYIQWAVLIIVSLILINDAMMSETVYEAVLLGGLALTSLIAGVIYQLKAFFFVGSGVLLLNVFLQTRAYWGNLPWWAYLLISGSILIAVASYNEWHKQKTSDGKETLFSKFNKRVIERIKKWE